VRAVIMLAGWRRTGILGGLGLWASWSWPVEAGALQGGRVRRLVYVSGAPGSGLVPPARRRRDGAALAAGGRRARRGDRGEPRALPRVRATSSSDAS